MSRRLEARVEHLRWVIGLLQQITVIANESNSVEDAFRQSLELVCSQLDWPVGHAVVPKPEEPEVFVDSGIWCVQDTGRFERFVEITRKSEFGTGKSLIGRVIASGALNQVPNVMEDPLFERAKEMKGCQIRAGFAFPVLIRRQVVAVLEFFACEESELAPDLIEGLAEFGTQLGRVVERKQLEQEIAEATAHEQQTIGRELHDSVAQELTGLGMLGDQLCGELEQARAPQAEQAARLVEHLKRVHQQVRRISHGLIPVQIDPEGLMAALKRLAESGQALSGIDCRFECPEPVLVESSAMATQLYRIAQEALQNAERHSAARQIVIELRRKDGAAKLIVRDNGKGLPGEGEKPEGMGAKIMQHRAGQIGAWLAFESAKGRGTAVVCTLPEGRLKGSA